MTINRKYNEEERAEIRTAIAVRAIANSAEQAPQTQEEFDKWAEKIVKEYHERKAKEKARQQKRTEKENQPGFKAKKFPKDRTFVRQRHSQNEHLCDKKTCKKNKFFLQKTIDKCFLIVYNLDTELRNEVNNNDNQQKVQRRRKSRN